MKGKLTLVLLLVVGMGFGQKQDRIWCFGSNSGIDFSDTLNPIPFTSNLPQYAIYSYASIADNGGNLQFYTAGCRWDTLGATIWNKNFQKMQNGDSINGEPNRAQALLIIPFPDDNNKYYLFSFSYISNRTTLNYSVIDMQQDGGAGAVIQKNIFLLRDTLCEKMNAVKHANGRDWWVLLRRYPDNTFYKYLVTPFGISGPYIQNIGTMTNTYYGEMEFTPQGDKLVAVGIFASIDLMDFDRCTGMLSNFTDLGEHTTFDPITTYYSCAFSLNASKLYVSTSPISPTDIKTIYQYDLTAGNIMASKQIIFSYADTSMNFFLGQMELAPNGKIYISKGDQYGTYSNSIYDQNLDYINYPDSLGGACDYCSNCFSLQGHGISETGLPNNPNYNLGALVGSPCDTIPLSTNQLSTFNSQLSIYPNPASSNSPTTFTYPSTSAQKQIIINDINGTEVARYALPQWSSIQHLKLPPLSSGIYIARLIGEGTLGNVKFAVE